MKLKNFISCYVIFILCEASTGNYEVNVCPSNESGCVTLDQLTGNLIESNTTFKLMPSMFKMMTDTIIKFVDVSNVIIKSAALHEASITCVGENSGFIFHNVSRLVIQNVQFTGCGIKLQKNSTLVLSESSDILLQDVTIKYGKAYGILGTNIYGFFTINNSVFTHMQGSGLSLKYQKSLEYHFNKTDSKPNVTVSNSLFDNANYHLFEGLACAIEITFFEQHFPAMIYIVDVTVTNNTHTNDVSGIFIWSFSSIPNHIILERYNYKNNHVVDNVHLNGVGGSDFLYIYDGDISEGTPTVIEITDSNFTNNNYYANDVDQLSVDSIAYGALLFYINHFSSPHVISVRNITISNNTGIYSATILCEAITNQNLIFEMINSNIINNNLHLSLYSKNGAVNIKGAGNITVHNSSILNNTGTGLLVENSIVYFSGENHVRHNKAYNGGGIALYWNSELHLLNNVMLIIEGNHAENFGGGLYVKLSENGDTTISNCFFKLQYVHTVSLEFCNNSAKIAGNDIYGGNLHMCKVFTSDGFETGWQVMANIIQSPDNYVIDLTSDPVHVCDCFTPNCIQVVRTIKSVQIHPGKLFSLPLVAVGQVLNITTLSGVPSAIYARLLPQNVSGTIPEPMTVQIGKRICSELTYRIYSVNYYEIMVLTVDNTVNAIQEYFVMLWQDPLWNEHVSNLLLHDLIVPAYIEIELLPCPVGFELSVKGDCICSTFLIEFVTSCSIDTLLFQRKPSIWFTVVHQNNFTTLYLTHKHCPFDYCKPGSFEFLLDNSNDQCNHNRSGILCGKCEPGYSITLGRMECRECTNIYLLLLIPFAFAGILLVIFLAFTDMTVAAGTINGLLFYANIVKENQITFFSSQADGGFLSVFIAWLNMDFGITTCLYDGLDAYALTWLQYLFPLFTWLIALSIIIARKHFKCISKVFGSTVPVLATLFLLSYSKLQHAIVISISPAVIDVSNGSKHLVWLRDGNLQYFQGKHIPLFLVNLIFLVIIFIPYSLFTLPGPWHKFMKLKAFFYVYSAPLKAKHRYWIGVLLLSRIILSLVSAVNSFGDDSVNLLAIIILSFILVMMLWQSGGVYKTWAFSILDSFFLINLGILASVTLYNKLVQGKQHITIYVSTGITFAVFCLILLYHCYKKLKTYKSSGIMPRQDNRPLLEKINSDELDSDDVYYKTN